MTERIEYHAMISSPGTQRPSYAASQSVLDRRENISESLRQMRQNHHIREKDIIQKEKDKIDIIIRTISCRSVAQQKVTSPRVRHTMHKQEERAVDRPPLEATGPLRLFNCKLTTGWKPAHRYKTCMLEYGGKLYLYGGLGCEKLITWTCFDLATRKWSNIELDDSVQNLQNRPRFPRYSHSMVLHKNKAIIYGGFMLEICSDVTIFDLDKLQYSSGCRGPPRRDHAVACIGKSMLIHGGTQQGNTLSNDFYIYNIEQDVWCEVKATGTDKPYLSHHKMVSSYRKAKKYHRYGETPLPEEVFMFGGKNAEGLCVNDFYKIRLEGVTAKIQKIKTKKTPKARSEHSLEFLQTGHIVLYGGRDNEQIQTKRCYNGVYQDIHIYDIVKNAWHQPYVAGYPVLVRFGMASAVIGSSIMVFGGCNGSHFCDGDIYQIETDSSKIPKLQELMNQQIQEIQMVECCDHKLKMTITKLLRTGNKNFLQKLR